MTRPSRRIRLHLLIAVLSLSVVFTPMSGSAAQATPGIIGGRIFRDLNNNGTFDADEPGIAGLMVSGHGPAVISDATGTWTMAVPLRTIKVRVSTGWYRSECNSLDCPAGPGPDNDFAVDNQFITAMIDGAVGGQLDVGLLPDWPGYYPIPTPLAGEAIPSNEIDVSTRLSWIWPAAPGNCYRTANAKHHGCTIGDTPAGALQVSNEGTAPLTGISGYLEVPPLTTILPAVASANPGNHPEITAFVIGALDPITNRAPFEIVGTLPPGAAAQYILYARLEPGSPPSPLPLLTANPYVPNEMFVTITSPVDPDGCLAEPCPRGQHDKQAPADNTDFHGWQVITGLIKPIAAKLDFGSIAPDVSSALLATFTNVGASPAQIQSVGVTGAAAGEYSLPDPSGCLTEPLNPGMTCQTEILFEPNGVGPRDATVEIVSPDAPMSTMKLTGRILFPVPTITSFTPTGATPGKTITILGSNLNSRFTRTEVTFTGAPPVTATVHPDGTSLAVAIPAGALQGTVKVTTDGGTASSNGFVVRRAPADLVVEPNSAEPGVIVTIRGHNLKGTTSVKFNGVVAAYTVVGPNRITAKVPAKATTGPVRVANPWGTAASATFTVVPPVAPPPPPDAPPPLASPPLA